MHSEFDTFAEEFCSPMAAELFGVRGEDGELTDFIYTRPDGHEFPLTGWSIHTRSHREEMQEDGSVKQVETMVIRGPRADLEANQVTRFQSRAKVQVGEETWLTDAITTEWGTNSVALGLAREPLTGMPEMRHAPI